MQIIYVSWKEELGILESKNDKITDKKLLIIVNQFRVQKVSKSYKTERFRLLSRMDIHKSYLHSCRDRGCTFGNIYVIDLRSNNDTYSFLCNIQASDLSGHT